MFRNYDWQCSCGETVQFMVQFPTGDRPVAQLGLWCGTCQAVTVHDRLISLTAPYMGEKMLNPMVSGGKFDTMGMASLPKIPDALPSSATWSDYKDRWQSKEWKEFKKETASVKKQNRQKQKRAAAIKRGENINMRTCKLPGDPKIAS